MGRRPAARGGRQRRPRRSRSATSTPSATRRRCTSPPRRLGRAARGARAGGSFELEFSGRAQPLRRLLPAGEGANVVARVPAARSGAADARARGPPRRRPHRPDVASARWPAGRGERRPAAVLAAARAGDGGARRGPARGCACPPGRCSRLAAALSLEVTRGATVPGASDNATGVAAVLALVRPARRRPAARHRGRSPCCPGCEESGMGGMAAWLRAEGTPLDPASTLVLGLDTLGAGEPMVVHRRGPAVARALPRARTSPLVDAAAVAARASPPPRRFRIGGWTDPALARARRRCPPSRCSRCAATGSPTTTCRPTRPTNVDWDSVDACVELAEAVARASSRPAPASRRP